MTMTRSLLTYALLLLTLCGCAPESPEQTPVSVAPAVKSPGRIDRERLLAADSEPENWFSTGRDFGKSHYSPLTEINKTNIGRLGLAWEYQTQTKRGLEATPIVVDGFMYTSGPLGRVYALDARTGSELWTFDPQADMQANRAACCDQVNRGVAVWQGKVYVASLDGRLFALAAATGEVLWEVDTIIDHKRGYTSTGAPEIAGKTVVIGNAGSEYDARGYITAYDLESGKQVWRFFIVPGDPKLGYEHPELETAAKTWDPNSRWDVGLGGTVYDAMVYDPELDVLYVGTGNAALYNQAERSPAGGDNLYLASILAINPNDGRLIWHYQETPGDRWDYTATQPLILADLQIDGAPRKVIMQAPKNGFFYILDRVSGELLSAEKYVPASWASHVDMETGRPVVNAATSDYSNGVKFVFPSTMGGHNWNPMAYSPDTGLVYIPVIEAGNFLFDPTAGHDYIPSLLNGGVAIFQPIGLTLSAAGLPPEVKAKMESGELFGDESELQMRALLRAWDPIKKTAVWEHEAAAYWDHGGVLATGGGLVFQGTATGQLNVYAADNGTLLKSIEVGTSIIAAPTTYAIDGVQYVAVMAGWGGGGWMIPQEGAAFLRYGNAGRILAFKLDGGPVPLPEPLPPVAPIPEPPPQTANTEAVARGAQLYAGMCAICHLNMTGAPVADLRRMSRETHDRFREIVMDGVYLPLGMPRWNDVLSDADLEAIHAYIIAISWDAYRETQAQRK
jgi:quinohemoprotein ethanol dehydrogenase